MENILFKYMVDRFNAEEKGKIIQQKDLPFITISREFGCPANELARLIIEKLNLEEEKKKDAQRWNKLNKEILQAASQELHVDPTRIRKIFNDEKRGAIDEILNALSDKYYQSDRKILKTIDKVILDFAMRGHVVIVGRGGMAVTRQLSRGIHVRLFAPLNWRLEQLLKTGSCKTIEEANAIAKKMDFKRNALLKKKTEGENYEDNFDVFYNCKYLSAEEIANSIIQLLQSKKLK